MNPKKKSQTKLSKTTGIILLILIASYMPLLTGCSQEKHITIPAECGAIMGSLLNKIETEEDCRVQCRNDCFAIEYELSRSVLVQNNATMCNSCECYCKK
ncbi:hypothetical protein A3K72_02930 [Candidatus Woesearchaeota archaeon RBG_13_36_6]|nr:MAG: hypothetical protein A3K72_02930 [Candidatus Woesearchaeota archaeon RBG_13_36_6]